MRRNAAIYRSLLYLLVVLAVLETAKYLQNKNEACFKLLEQTSTQPEGISNIWKPPI